MPCVGSIRPQTDTGEISLPALQEFELIAIGLVAAGVLSPPQLDLLRRVEELDGYSCSSGGYFLTIKDSRLPNERLVLSDPPVVGNAGDVQVGFVVFLGGHELVLECHKWGAVDLPDDFRHLDVAISTPPVNCVDLRG